MVARFTRKDFLEAIFAQYYKEHRGFILVKSVKRGDPKMSTRYFPNIDILAKEHYGEDRDVYFGICPRERMKAEKEHVHYVVALWADLDIGSEGHDGKKTFFEGPQQAARAIRSFPRAPSIIVESGRGAHLYWLLKEVTEVSDPERVEKILQNIGTHLNCDTDVNLDTALRLPETVNTKIAGKPVNCDVKFINPNFRYMLQDFENLSQRIVQPAAGPSAAAAGRPDPAAAPVFSPDSAGEEARSPLSVASQAVDDSLVLDETIIDELIDDISMTGSVVTDIVAPPLEAPDSGDRPTSMVSSPRIAPSLAPPIAPRASSVSSVLERLSTAKTEVEILLLGSATTISGVLSWNENGLIGVESGQDLYTIPVSSIAFIKSKAS
ncbi:MAG: hypothetical protein HY913_03630 [Desulfomonile tiedjei]|nr:hypothetical protein [Desulfomonile tiedjei]